MILRPTTSESRPNICCQRRWLITTGWQVLGIAIALTTVVFALIDGVLFEPAVLRPPVLFVVSASYKGQPSEQASAAAHSTGARAARYLHLASTALA